MDGGENAVSYFYTAHFQSTLKRSKTEVSKTMKLRHQTNHCYEVAFSVVFNCDLWTAKMNENVYVWTENV